MKNKTRAMIALVLVLGLGFAAPSASGATKFTVDEVKSVREIVTGTLIIQGVGTFQTGIGPNPATAPFQLHLPTGLVSGDVDRVKRCEKYLLLKLMNPGKYELLFDLGTDANYSSTSGYSLTPTNMNYATCRLGSAPTS